MYSNRTYYFQGGTSRVYGMHKEHSVPKSWWGGYETQGYSAYTDINHLYPRKARPTWPSPTGHWVRCQWYRV